VTLSGWALGGGQLQLEISEATYYKNCHVLVVIK